ncbi:hypothetical protein IW261DRAFT_1426609 [Armillaria novae-zelandiae]|uniref:Uncharacterized protein n=1 Tax=Armillaria novae-zelandiae TaxID=153914 RepID=A0AA39NKP2_9AGAR|nr:hypothetical protein IW261DRAFT_1426609 [Armillaria novae-zelandiae]
MSENNLVQWQAISTRFACKTIPDLDEEGEVEEQDHHMVQEDKPLFELEALGHPVLLADINTDQVRDFEFIWMMAGPIHGIVGDRRSPAHRRMQEAFNIISNKYKVNLRSYTYLSLDQYDFFHPTMMVLEELLSNVHLSDTHDGDCAFCLDQQRFSRFMTWLTLNELKVSRIHFQAETEHFLATLLTFHDWETGTPKWFHEDGDVTPISQQVRFLKQEEAKQSVELPWHANGHRRQPSFTEI